VLGSALLSAGIIGDSAGADEPKPDKQALIEKELALREGKWRLKEFRRGVFPPEIGRTELEISKKELRFTTVEAGDHTVRITVLPFWIDPTQSPKHLDDPALDPSWRPIQNLLNVYELDGDVLYVSLRFDNTRPTEVVPKDDNTRSEMFIRVYERVKPAKESVKPPKEQSP
jgi:uncharacterized protein (TIGR03067 family)